MDVEEEAQKVDDEAPDGDSRAEAPMVRSEPGDAQDIPDALRDEKANAEGRKGAKSLDTAPTNKMVEKAKNK